MFNRNYAGVVDQYTVLGESYVMIVKILIGMVFLNAFYCQNSVAKDRCSSFLNLYVESERIQENTMKYCLLIQESNALRHSFTRLHGEKLWNELSWYKDGEDFGMKINNFDLDIDAAISMGKLLNSNKGLIHEKIQVVEVNETYSFVLLDSSWVFETEPRGYESISAQNMQGYIDGAIEARKLLKNNVEPKAVMDFFHKRVTIPFLNNSFIDE